MNPNLDYYRPWGVQAVADVVVNGVPSAGATVTVAGDAFTFGTDFQGDNPIQIAIGLAAAINASRGTYGARHNQSTLLRSYAAVYYGTRIELLATAPGVAGNALTLATSDATNFTVSGATFGGGAVGTAVLAYSGLPPIAACVKLDRVPIALQLAGPDERLVAAYVKARYVHLANEQGNNEVLYGSVGALRTILPTNPSAMSERADSGGYLELSEIYVNGTATQWIYGYYLV